MQIRPAYRPVLVLGLLAGVLATLLLHAAGQPPEPRLRPVATVTSAIKVLHEWDARRSTAYAEGDVASLTGLYVPGSSAAAADARMLRSYLRQGLRVRWLTTQVFSVRVLTRRADLLRLAVVDRISGGAVVGRARCFALPRDHADARSIQLRRVAGHWLVASVTT